MVYIHRHELISTTSTAVSIYSGHRQNRHESPDAPQQQQRTQQHSGDSESHDISHKQDLLA
jgi:hypothetical protein